LDKKSYQENIITVDTGERLNLNYISATKKHQVMTKQIELLYCELKNSKCAFLLYPEEVPDYLLETLLSHFDLEISDLTVLSQYPPVIDTHSLTLFGSDINVDEADILTEASLVTFGTVNTHKNQNNKLPVAHEQFKPLELVTCLVKKLESSEKSMNFNGYAISEEAMGILSLAGVEQFLKLEFPDLKISEILNSLKRKFNEQQMRIYT